MSLPATSLEIRSELRKDSTLALSLAEVPVPEPGPAEVLVRIEAAPINPSDLGVMFGVAELGGAKQSGSAERPVVTAEVPERLAKVMAPRLGRSIACGNEGAGVVVATGSGVAARALLGKTVAIFGGPTYAQYRSVAATACLVLHDGTTPAEGASCFVNPLTVLGMVDTMRLEGHRALVHTAAASNLGQMLEKLCQAERVELVNVVRRPEQVEILRGLRARHVCDSSRPDFAAKLTEACGATGATLAFDATGGGRLAGQILSAMEAALTRNATEVSRYGSTTHKQVYIYGGLERTPTTLERNFGMAWGIGGWLLPLFLQRVGPTRTEELRQRVADEIKTTFASHYTKQVSLAGALQLDAIAAYGRQATGEKYLVTPQE